MEMMLLFFLRRGDERGSYHRFIRYARDVCYGGMQNIRRCKLRGGVIHQKEGREGGGYEKTVENGTTEEAKEEGTGFIGRSYHAMVVLSKSG
jgi:hypothetical protein